MSQDTTNQLSALEAAIMTRARELAKEFEDKADHQRDTILRDAAERLHMAEEREVLVAKAEAERHFRRVTQARELKMQAHLDQLRWELVQAVQTRLSDRMQEFRADRDAYRRWLVELLQDAAESLPEGELIAEVTSEDHGWVEEQWRDLVSEAAPSRVIALAERPTWGIAGIRLRTADNRAQVDNRFEGRLARLQPIIQKEILQALFPTDIHASARSGGPQ